MSPLVEAPAITRDIKERPKSVIPNYLTAGDIATSRAFGTRMPGSYPVIFPVPATDVSEPFRPRTFIPSEVFNFIDFLAGGYLHRCLLIDIFLTHRHQNLLPAYMPSLVSPP